MDYLSLIKKPIEAELKAFSDLFNTSLSHTGMLQEEIFSRIRQRVGKRMRPMLIMLMAKNYGFVSDVTLQAALGIELLHTASLVHDDVVDESLERRGQSSVNNSYGNKVAVLVGDGRGSRLSLALNLGAIRAGGGLRGGGSGGAVLVDGDDAGPGAKL